jgi:hypothetical protein
VVGVASQPVLRIHKSWGESKPHWNIGMSSVRSLDTPAHRPSLRQCVDHNPVGRARMDSKRRGRMKRRIAALCVLLLVGFVSRYWLWRSVPILPYGLLPILRFDPQLRCASREEVLKRLGEPYYEEGRYSYVPAKEERAGVIFNYDASNRISHVNFCFSTGLYVLSRSRLLGSIQLSCESEPRFLHANAICRLRARWEC